MVYYWNFIMTNEEHISKRINYQIIDMLSELGGLFAAMTFIVGSFF